MTEQNPAYITRASDKDPFKEYFPTPPAMTRVLCERILPKFWSKPELAAFTCLEPACGMGHMAFVLSDYFKTVEAFDITPYGYGAVQDFMRYKPLERPDFIITNPPFAITLPFILRAINMAKIGVAMLVPSRYMHGVNRWNDLWSKFPPVIYAPFSERVAILKGRIDLDATTAAEYMWVVIRKRYDPCLKTQGSLLAQVPPGVIKKMIWAKDCEKFNLDDRRSRAILHPNLFEEVVS